MGVSEVRIPKQKRSAEKRQAIIQAGFTLFCEKGYYRTNTAEIAKAAGVSTGIVYSYFHDKKDILKEAVHLYVVRLEKEFSVFFNADMKKEELPSVIEGFVDAVVSSHTMNRKAHNEFLALAFLDGDIDILFEEFENRILYRLSQKLIAAGYEEKHIMEKLRIAYGIVEQFCHDQMNGKIREEERKYFGQLIISTILSLLES